MATKGTNLWFQSEEEMTLVFLGKISVAPSFTPSPGLARPGTLIPSVRSQRVNLAPFLVLSPWFSTGRSPVFSDRGLSLGLSTIVWGPSLSQNARPVTSKLWIGDIILVSPPSFFNRKTAQTSACTSCFSSFTARSLLRATLVSLLPSEGFSALILHKHCCCISDWFSFFFPEYLLPSCYSCRSPQLTVWPFPLLCTVDNSEEHFCSCLLNLNFLFQYKFMTRYIFIYFFLLKLLPTCLHTNSFFTNV